MMNDRIHMLLVEDEQTLADIIADTLGEKEFDVTVAYNGVEGLRRFDEVHPDVVVTDIMMPGMDRFSSSRPGLPSMMWSMDSKRAATTTCANPLP